MKLTNVDFKELRGLDKQTISILLSVVILLVISDLFVSKLYFNYLILNYFDSEVRELVSYILWYSGDFIILFLVPVLMTKYFFRKKVSSFGLNLNNLKTGLEVSIIAFVVILSVTWLISAEKTFSEYYPYLQTAKNDWNSFIIYECGLFLFVFAWEYFWRGYMLFGLEKIFGIYSVFVQMVPFVLMHSGKPFLESLGAIFGGIFLGYLAFKTRSFFYGFVMHFLLIFSTDLFSTLRFRQNEFGIGLKAFTKIFFN